jgi:hypothetical protein
MLMLLTGTPALEWAYPLAQAAGGVDWLSEVGKWGPGGVLVVLVLIGIIVPKYVVDRLDKDLVRLQAQRDDLIAQQAEVIPVLVEVQKTMLPAVAAVQHALESQTRELAQLRDEVRRLQSVNGPRTRGTTG